MKLSFCWLGEEKSLELILIELFLCSKNQLKLSLSKEARVKTIFSKKEIQIPLDLANHRQINPVYTGERVDVLFENEDYLAIHKPPFIHSHPLKYSDTNTAINSLVGLKKWQVLEVNQKNYDRGLLYRLDFETSGVLLLAKKQFLYDQVRANFRSLMKEKFYLAIVQGDFHLDGRHLHFLRSNYSKQVCSDVEVSEGQEANLDVKKIMAHEGHSLLLIRLHEGHRHQIRAQLSFLGFPILGDELYGGEKSSRLFLHAFEYRGEVTVRDEKAELFELFFDLNRAFKMIHDMSGVIDRREF